MGILSFRDNNLTFSDCNHQHLFLLITKNKNKQYCCSVLVRNKLFSEWIAVRFIGGKVEFPKFKVSWLFESNHSVKQ